MEGLVTAIGLGGMFVSTGCGPPRCATSRLKTTDPLLSFECDCIVRDTGDHGVGVELVGPTPENEAQLRQLLLLLKGAVAGRSAGGYCLPRAMAQLSRLAGVNMGAWIFE
jgi:hypothetical protein